jgi:AcrR family transcriptional regulator
MARQPKTTEIAAEQGPTTDSASDPERAMRADARRNNDRLVVAAKVVFAAQGGDASMDAIAREAGVGVGTLYRHFPKRIDIVEAVYRNDVDDLILAAEKAAANLEPWPAVVNWLEAFIRYAIGKRTFLNELREAFEKNPQLHVSSRERIETAFRGILDRAQAAGVARTDVDGADLVQLIGAMCTSATLQEGQAERLLAVILDGLRPPN